MKVKMNFRFFPQVFNLLSIGLSLHINSYLFVKFLMDGSNQSKSIGAKTIFLVHLADILSSMPH